MFLNYLKVLFRNLIRRKSFSLINIAGLAVGIAASILIALWVFDELTYDQFHDNSDRIYRVQREGYYQGQFFDAPATGAQYGPTLKQDYPQIEEHVRFYRMTLSVNDNRNVAHQEKVFFSDEGLFDVFTFPLKHGNAETALKKPNSVVLTQHAAGVYFGDQNPMNKPLEIELDGEKRTFTVTGIFKEIPNNSHVHFDVVASFSTLEPLRREQFSNWLSNYLYTYVLVKEGTDVKKLETQFTDFQKRYLAEDYQRFLKGRDINDVITMKMKPLTDIHLNPTSQWEIEAQGSKTSVYIFTGVSILILLIAAFNFMNLSTAMAGRRSLEVGVRKTLGARKKQLVAQFLGESIIITLIAFIIALIIVEITLPHYNNFINKELHLGMLTEPALVMAVAIILILTGVLAGLYPAFYLSSYKPIKVLKGTVDKLPGKFNFRQVLVMAQFIFSIALIIGTITSYLQLSYLQNKPLGWDKENIITIPVENERVRNHFEAYRSELENHSAIERVSSSSNAPIGGGFSDTGFETELSEDVFLCKFINIDGNYLDTYGMELIAGRNLDEEREGDFMHRFIINETALKKLNITNPEDAIGKRYHMGHVETDVPGKIIGVVKDFHFMPLSHPIEPLSLFMREAGRYRISVRTEEGQHQEALNVIRKKWKEHFGGIQFNYEFASNAIDRQYAAESRLKTILIIFTILAIFIASLGLYGLAAFTAQQKTKEIGIRKVFGASVDSILTMMTRQFTRWVLLANIIAWPVAYILLDDWLSSFAYRIGIQWWVFIGAAVISVMVALITVSFQSYRAALTNPADSIRYE
ncbi:MAG: ABC transporter permease [Bacteroidales bacterium]|nr:ABC transporter permease [Bacteroidales bacterium]